MARSKQCITSANQALVRALERGGHSAGGDHSAEKLHLQAQLVKTALLQGADPNLHFKTGFIFSEALVFAVYEKNQEAIRHLVEAGADLSRHKDGWGALVVALVTDEACASLLIKLGAPIFTLPAPEESNLFLWAASNTPDTPDTLPLKPLLAYLSRAHINGGLDEEGTTLLMSAANSGNLQHCKLILEHPFFSNINAQNHQGLTALHMAAHYASLGKSDSFLWDILPDMVQKGFDFSLTDHEGKTASERILVELRKGLDVKVISKNNYQHYCDEIHALTEQWLLKQSTEQPSNPTYRKHIKVL